jgi:hypothetical protein
MILFEACLPEVDALFFCFTQRDLQSLAITSLSVISFSTYKKLPTVEV